MQNNNRRESLLSKKDLAFREVISQKIGLQEYNTPPLFIDGKVYMLYYCSFYVYDMESGREVGIHIPLKIL